MLAIVDILELDFCVNVEILAREIDKILDQFGDRARFQVNIFQPFFDGHHFRGLMAIIVYNIDIRACLMFKSIMLSLNYFEEVREREIHRIIFSLYLHSCL